MVELKDVAVTIRDILETGGSGYGKDVHMVTYFFAKEKLKEVIEANQILLKENAEIAKKYELLYYENERLRKGGK